MPILDILYKLNHIILVFCDGLPLLSIIFLRFIHVLTDIYISFLPYFQLIFNCILMYSILLTHLSLNRYLSCFNFLAVMNNTWAHANKFCIFISFLRVELLGNKVILCLTFCGTTKLFSKVAAQFSIPTSNEWRFQ